MTSAPEDTCDCTCFDEGEWVESRLNADVFGIVVSNSDFGRYVQVQVVGTLQIETFHAVTIRHMHAPDEVPPAAAADNVVHVDFTKRRPLTPGSEEGAA